MHDTYTFSEQDPRLTVEKYDLCPSLPADTPGLYLESVQDDRRGLIFHCANGSNLTPMIARITAVFSQETLMGYRMHSNCMSIQQEEELIHLLKLADLFPTRRVSQILRCRYTNYFNWCLWENSLYYDAVDTSELFHYMLFFSSDEWYDVLSTAAPRVFVERFGARLSDAELDRNYPEDAIFYR